MKYLPFVSAELGEPMRHRTRWQRIALWGVCCWFLLAGLAHFAFTDFQARLLPPQVPDGPDVVLVIGIVELLGAFGLLLPWTRRVAGWGLLLLMLALTPGVVWALHLHDPFPVPAWLLWLRLPLQLLLLWLIWWGSRWRAVRRWY